MVTLSVEKRAPGALGALRRAGKVPGVVYGPHQEALTISVDANTFEKVLREAGEASVVSLEGIGEALPTLVHEVDLDPLTSRPRHIDFYAVTKGEKVEVEVPISFIGESPAVKAGANLIKVLHELGIEADPMNLPRELVVDISSLAVVGDQIHARDIALPAGVTLITEPEEVVVLIQEVEEEKVEEAPADLSAIEVEKKGKEEEGAADAEAPKE